MLVSSLFEYAVLRVVPRVERGEFINVGVVLYCPETRFLDARVCLDLERLRVLDPGLEPGVVLAHLEAARLVCAGGPEAGAVGLLPPGQRFGWLVAPRSTVVQPSPVHTGFSDDPEAALEHLLKVMVYPLGRDGGAQTGMRP
jgi:Protein of unknown function (DUF3037)